MSEELDTTAALAYETYRTAHAGTVAGGLPMPVWEHLSVPERAAWLAVAALTVAPDPPAVRRQAEAPHRPPSPPPQRWTQHDLEQMTVPELRDLAQAQALSVPTSASKQHLIDALLADHDRREG